MDNHEPVIVNPINKILIDSENRITFVQLLNLNGSNEILIIELAGIVAKLNAIRFPTGNLQEHLGNLSKDNIFLFYGHIQTYIRDRQSRFEQFDIKISVFGLTLYNSIKNKLRTDDVYVLLFFILSFILTKGDKSERDQEDILFVMSYILKKKWDHSLFDFCQTYQISKSIATDNLLDRFSYNNCGHIDTFNKKIGEIGLIAANKKGWLTQDKVFRYAWSFDKY